MHLLAYPTVILGLAAGLFSLLAWLTILVLGIATLARTDWHVHVERVRSTVVVALGALAVVVAAVLVVAMWIGFQHTQIGP